MVNLFVVTQGEAVCWYKDHCCPDSDSFVVSWYPRRLLYSCQRKHEHRTSVTSILALILEVYHSRSTGECIQGNVFRELIRQIFLLHYNIYSLCIYKINRFSICYHFNHFNRVTDSYRTKSL